MNGTKSLTLKSREESDASSGNSASHVAKTGMEGKSVGSEGKDGLPNWLGGCSRSFSHTVMFIHLFIKKVLIIQNVPYCGLGIVPGTGTETKIRNNKNKQTIKKQAQLSSD